MSSAQRLFCHRAITLLRHIVVLGIVPFALLACSGLTKSDETANWSEDKLYSEAKEYMDGGDYTKAVKYFEILETRYPFGVYTQQAQINIAYSNWKDGELNAALAAADRFIQLHPDHPNVDYAYYLKGLINFNDNLGWLGRFSGQDLSERDPSSARNAFDTFKILVTRFPNSKYTPDARQRMHYIADSLAKHEVQVAEHYLLRGAYIAAANRAQRALKDSEHTAVTEHALIIMIKAYDAMGIKQLRDDSERVLKKSFPNSRYFNHQELDDGVLHPKKAWWQIW